MANFQYVMSPTGKLFHECDSYVKMICGPYGSGKSCCCAVDVLSYACAQAPAPDGVRYSRIGVVRATYPELHDATRRSLLEVLPSEYGTILSSGAPMEGIYRIPLPDGTMVQMELALWAIRTADDAQKLKSSNWTFAWINEATGVSPEVFSVVSSRTSRYPSEDLGGISWGGIIMDFNQPAPGTWLAEFIKNPQPNWSVFLQPPAAFKREDSQGRTYYEVNESAENLRNLGGKEAGDPEDMLPEERGKRYYRNQIDGLLKSGRTDIIDNQYCMLDVPVVDGKPVYTNFSITRHVAPEHLNPVMFQDILVGIDQSGIHPAAVILQFQEGKWCILDEMYADGEGLENFIQGILVPLLRSKYSTNPVTAAIDPSNTRDSWQAVTPRERLEEVGITAVTEISNNPKLRIQTVEHMLNLDTGGILVSPDCELLIRGFQSEYRYRRLRAAGSIGAVYTPVPEKNDASHLHDALQYAALLIHQGQKEDSVDVSHIAEVLSRKSKLYRRVV